MKSYVPLYGFRVFWYGVQTAIPSYISREKIDRAERGESFEWLKYANLLRNDRDRVNLAIMKTLKFGVLC